MPFKEVALTDSFSDDLAGVLGDADTGFVQSVFLNQGPIIKLWAVVMVVNMLMILFML